MKRFFTALALSSLLFSPSFADGVKIDGKNLTFDTPDLKAKLSLDGTELSGKDVSWSVADPYVVSVDEEGAVVSLSGGETVVTAASGSSKVDFSVKVEEPSRAPTSDVLDAKSLSGKIEVVMCGDSIMRDYKPNSVDQYGLGQAMKEFWDSSKVDVDNSVSNGGRSSRYFYNEPSRWPAVKKMLEDNRKSGKTTVVFFSFGHNDQRSLAGGDSKVGPYGASFTFAEKNQNGTVAGTHYDYIERYIVETRELGGIRITMFELGARIRAMFNNRQGTELDVLDDILSYPFIAIDEIGRTKGSEAELNWLSYLIDKAHSRGIPLMLISNKEKARNLPEERRGESFEMYLPNDAISRLRQDTKIIELRGRDRRGDLNANIL